MGGDFHCIIDPSEDELPRCRTSPSSEAQTLQIICNGIGALMPAEAFFQNIEISLSFHKTHSRLD